MAVEMWVTRDHDAEWKRWTASLDHIAQRISAVNGVTTTIVLPAGLSNRTPSLKVLWNGERFGITGETVARSLLDGDPRIALFPTGDARDSANTGISITPYMLSPGEERIIADRLHSVLSSPPPQRRSTETAPAADLTGQWDVEIEYAATRSKHTFHLRQRGPEIDGAHAGDFVSRDLSGTMDGDTVRLRSIYGEEHGDALSFTFSGTVTADRMAGTLDMGEYLAAHWSAKRHDSSRAS
jgi:hypothetical protein